MKRVVITGATSFLGAAVVSKFRSAGYEVVAVVRRNSGNISRLAGIDGVKLVQLNLDELDQLPSMVSSADVFMHFAWDGSGSEGRKDPVIQGRNYEYSMEALKKARDLGCKVFLFPGSQAEYGKCLSMMSEESPCAPESEYGKNKYKFGNDADKLLKDQSMFFLHLRIFSVYGENDRPGTLVEGCIDAFQQGKEMLLGACTQLWNYLYIDDFSNIVYALVERQLASGDLKGIYNIGGKETKCLKDFVEDIYEISDQKGSFVFGQRGENAEGSPSLCPDLTKLGEVFPLETLKTFQEGVRCIMDKKYGKKCIVCGKRLGGEPLLSFNKMPASAQNIPAYDELEGEKSIDLHLYQCDGCGLVQFACEPVDYYKDVIRSGGYSTTMVELRRKQYTHLIEKYNLSGKKIIEVGCGQGEFLGVLSEFDVQPYGIENKKELADIAAGKGLNVKQGFITDQGLLQEEGPFSAFLSFNFLEHQPDPNAMMQCIYDVLEEDGVGLITVPSFEYILKYDGYYEFIRDHIAYYTFDSLRILVEKNGFEVLEQEMINRDTLSVIVRKRKKFNLHHIQTGYLAIKEEFKAFYTECKKKGNRVAIWGASHQGFTIAASLELGEETEYIVDSAPFKQGKYAPGSHIRIISPGEFFADPVEVIVIIAPGYTEEIRRNILNGCKKEIQIYTLRTNHLEKL